MSRQNTKGFDGLPDLPGVPVTHLHVARSVIVRFGGMLRYQAHPQHNLPESAAGEVLDDTENKGLQRRFIVKSCRTGEYSDIGFLHEVLCRRPVKPAPGKGPAVNLAVYGLQCLT
jgi:hypothetical protein